jgi:hypothetical protein
MGRCVDRVHRPTLQDFIIEGRAAVRAHASPHLAQLHGPTTPRMPSSAPGTEFAEPHQTTSTSFADRIARSLVTRGASHSSAVATMKRSAGSSCISRASAATPMWASSATIRIFHGHEAGHRLAALGDDNLPFGRRYVVDQGQTPLLEHPGRHLLSIRDHGHNLWPSGRKVRTATDPLVTERRPAWTQRSAVKAARMCRR